jgi:hypothetical protein
MLKLGNGCQWGENFVITKLEKEGIAMEIV